MNDIIPGARAGGEVLLDGQNICAPGIDVVEVLNWWSMARPPSCSADRGTRERKTTSPNVSAGKRVSCA